MNNDDITFTSAQHDKLYLNENGSRIFAYIEDCQGYYMNKQLKVAILRIIKEVHQQLSFLP